MKKIFTIISLFFSNFSIAQNLVPNWSFEDTISCPVSLGQIFRSSGWSSYLETPDYFNSCDINHVGVPFNDGGFQFPKTGNAYAGIVTHAKFSLSHRECFGIQLLQPLSIGQMYYISFYASRGLNKNLNSNIATNKLGARFTTVPYTQLNPLQIDNFSHIYSDSVISDTLNWFLVSGFFVADSSYEYLSIANFYRDSFTTRIIFDSTAVVAYYYIDDVKVIDSTLTGIIKNNIIKVKVFPNPARDWIVLEGKGIKSVEILNALGSEIGSYPTTAFTLQNQINLSSLSCGIYFLKINMIDNKFHFQKIIVQN